MPSQFIESLALRESSNKLRLTFLIILFSLYAYGDETRCLSFLEGRLINRVQQFLVTHPDFSQYLHPSTKLYSAQFDLNEDGSPEYFYYMETPAFCGQQAGCPINVYEYKNGKFRELVKYGIHTFDEFNPVEQEHSNYICVRPDRSSGWHNLIIQNKWLAKYNGTEYIIEGENNHEL